MTTKQLLTTGAIALGLGSLVLEHARREKIVLERIMAPLVRGCWGDCLGHFKTESGGLSESGL